MSDYSQGKIYKLTCSETDKVYIGSSTKSLKERLRHHNYPNNYCVCRDFINPKIELIETYPCETKEKLLWKEREYIENTDCVNKCLPIMTLEEKQINRKISRLKWDKNNKESKKNYREKNREKINTAQNEKITCECGAITSRANKLRHLNTKKHLNHVGGLNTKR